MQGFLAERGRSRPRGQLYRRRGQLHEGAVCGPSIFVTHALEHPSLRARSARLIASPPPSTRWRRRARSPGVPRRSGLALCKESSIAVSAGPSSAKQREKIEDRCREKGSDSGGYRGAASTWHPGSDSIFRLPIGGPQSPQYPDCTRGDYSRQSREPARIEGARKPCRAVHPKLPRESLQNTTYQHLHPPR